MGRACLSLKSGGVLPQQEWYRGASDFVSLEFKETEFFYPAVRLQQISAEGHEEILNGQLITVG